MPHTNYTTPPNEHNSALHDAILAKRAKRARQAKEWREKQKAENREEYLEKERSRVKAHRDTQKTLDPDGLKERERLARKASRDKDLEKAREVGRKNAAAYRAKKLAEDPDSYREKRNAYSRERYQKKKAEEEAILAAFAASQHPQPE